MSSYFKGILIGVSIVIGSLILMGSSSKNSEAGTYQMSIGIVEEYSENHDQYFEYKRVVKINTKTGRVYYWNAVVGGWYEYK